PWYQEYELPVEPEMRILDCLNLIKWNLDGSLSYRMSCAHGVCGSCSMKINGRCGLACQKLVKDYEGQAVLVEPLPNFKVLRDLIVDMNQFFSLVESIRPYLIPRFAAPAKDRIQSQSDRKKIDEVIRCILCASCTAACPVTEENPEYLGPATIVQAFRRIFDTRDGEGDSRLKQMDHPDAVWPCKNYFECTRVCPKEIPVTKSINIIKQEIQKTAGEDKT
ncbi:MAG: succinate dehydrogenase iron-sulfur subunit, partial [Candidatus Adiutricales bacterium]